MSEESLPLPEQNYGPGNVLRAKREEYEWSVEAVAEALHLSTHSVKAIEGDRYDELPGATYVMGYWRSYARLLGIDIEETIEVNKRNLNIVTAEAAGMDVNRTFGNKRKRSSKPGLLLLVLFVGFAYFAWQQQYFGLLDRFISDEETPILLNSTPLEGTPEAAPILAEEKTAQVLRPLKPEPVEADELQLVRIETQSIDSQLAEGDAPLLSGQTVSGLKIQSPEAENPVVMQSATPAAQTGLVLAPGVVSPGADSEASITNEPIPLDKLEPNKSDVLTGDDTPLDTSTEPAPATTLAPGMQTVTLTLSKDSWLDIRDKTRKRLYYETGKAGQKIDVSGEPPFYVYIGTPDGVSIQYLGKSVPFETHKLGMFARFKLDNEMLEAL